MHTSDIFLTLEQSWKNALGVDLSAPYILKLKEFLKQEALCHQVFPPESCIFKSFAATPFHKVRVVIIGQDPYHGEGQAHGLCFSVNRGIAIPPSLRNIFKELHTDLGIYPPGHGNLEKWAAQGVLLLNATLTVRANQAGSHQKKGWEQFTEKAISTLSQQSEGLVFLLWGNAAREKKQLIDPNRHHILEAAHPSPLSASRGFSGCRHFSKANELLRASGKQEIDWRIE